MFARASLLTAFLASFSAVSAKTADGVFNGDTSKTLIDYQPPFTSPTGGEIWFAGFNYSASWSQTLPDGIAQENVSATANLVLGYTTEEDDSNLHLDWTLVKDVELYNPGENSVEFTLPGDLETHNTYFLVLLGSTNHQSPEFTVVANPIAAALGGSSSSSSAAATTTTSSGPLVSVTSLPPFPTPTTTPAAAAPTTTTTTSSASAANTSVAGSASRPLFRDTTVGRVRKVRRSGTVGAAGKLRRTN